MSREVLGRPSSLLADRVRSARFNSKPDAASAAPGPPCGVVELASLTSERSVSPEPIPNTSRRSRVATNDVAPAAANRVRRLPTQDPGDHMVARAPGAVRHCAPRRTGSCHLDSERFRSTPKVLHASMRKHLRCQRATFRAFGDKRLFREVSKTGALEIPVGLPPERAFVWQHAGLDHPRHYRRGEIPISSRS